MGTPPEESLITCSKCLEPKSLDDFYANGPGKRRGDCKECVKERRRNTYDPAYARERQAASYGLTVEQAELIWNATHCEICGDPDPKHPTGSFSIDHCHTTGRVRGALCSACNLGLGKFRDSPEFLRRAADYVERYV